MSATELRRIDVPTAIGSPESEHFMKGAASVLWPSFLVAGIAEMIVFSLVDPADLHLGFEIGRTGVYSLGFFAFWALMAVSSALTVWLCRSANEVNRCPMAFGDRPDGCPKSPGASS